MYKMDNDLEKKLTDILNQHGLNAILDCVVDEIERAYEYGHDVGVDEGWCECYDTYKEEIDGYDYAWE